jgi:hypothetical protein
MGPAAKRERYCGLFTGTKPKVAGLTMLIKLSDIIELKRVVLWALINWMKVRASWR